MKQMMGGLGANLGLLGNVPGMKQFAMAKNMRKAAKNTAMGGGHAAASRACPGCQGWAASRDGRLPGDAPACQE